VLCALGATAHYLKWAWENPWQLVGWLLSMVFLLIAFLPGPSERRANFKSVSKPKAAFFVFWVLFFVVAHLWDFRTAPWNGDGLFEDASVDLLFLKTHVTSRPFQAAWFHFSFASATVCCVVAGVCGYLTYRCIKGGIRK